MMRGLTDILNDLRYVIVTRWVYWRTGKLPPRLSPDFDTFVRNKDGVLAPPENPKD